LRQTCAAEENDHAQERSSMPEREKQRAADSTAVGRGSHDHVYSQSAAQMQARCKRKTLDAPKGSHKHRQRQQSEMTAAGVAGVS
ncbi:hypothetical protein BD311DRAFT_678829, partial [Dichomitus squalens]